jgi:molybdopterin synthase catalytic subunit
VTEQRADESQADVKQADEGRDGVTRDDDAGASLVRLVAVREEPLSVDETLAAVQDPAAGGTCVFVGAVRDVDHDRSVTALTYSAHPTVVGRLRDVAEQVASRHPVTAVAAVHRVGDLVVGDLAVVVAVSAPHRSEAFEACRDLIDTLKSTVPIWKYQGFADGSEEWVGLP